MKTETKLKVLVTYIGAGQPFDDPAASATETLGHLKGRVLEHFHLTEGGTPDGGQVTYRLFDGKTELTDLSKTLGDIAGGKPVVHLKLNEHVTQG
jgi:hypothetical protein